MAVIVLTVLILLLIYTELQPTFVPTDKIFFMSADAPIIIDDGSDDEAPFVTPTESPDVHQR